MFRGDMVTPPPLPLRPSVHASVCRSICTSVCPTPKKYTEKRVFFWCFYPQWMSRCIPYVGVFLVNYVNQFGIFLMNFSGTIATIKYIYTLFFLRWYDCLTFNCAPILLITLLEGTACYAGLLLTPAESFGLQPRTFLPFGKKRAFYAVFAYLRPFLMFSSNLSNFK